MRLLDFNHSRKCVLHGQLVRTSSKYAGNEWVNSVIEKLAAHPTANEFGHRLILPPGPNERLHEQPKFSPCGKQSRTHEAAWAPGKRDEDTIPDDESVSLCGCCLNDLALDSQEFDEAAQLFSGMGRVCTMLQQVPIGPLGRDYATGARRCFEDDHVMAVPGQVEACAQAGNPGTQNSDPSGFWHSVNPPNVETTRRGTCKLYVR